jgi:hypothetical protein
MIPINEKYFFYDYLSMKKSFLKEKHFTKTLLYQQLPLLIIFLIILLKILNGRHKKMRKIIGILIAMLMIGTVISSVGMNNQPIRKDETINVNELSCGYESDRNIHQSSKNNPYMNNMFTMETRKGIKETHISSPKPNIASYLPDYFSWKDYEGEDWTSPISRQECGDCWLFAAIGCLECIINVREESPNLDPDLSEQYVLSCFPKAGTCQGGWSEKAFQYMLDSSQEGNNYNGALLETCFRYKGIDSRGCDYDGCGNTPVLCSDKCEDWLNNLVPLKGYNHWYTDGSNEDIQRIKTSIMENGPVISYYLVDDGFREWIAESDDPNDYYPYTGEVTDLNHAVVLVGWKDDPSIGNGGYWIVKNSWGVYLGYNGFFNIEYGSLGINNFEITEVDYDPDDFDWAPNANAGGPYYGSIGTPITFDASKSVDPEGSIVSYEWDFGDGTTAEGSIVDHTFNKRGFFIVQLKAIDESGNIGYEETNALIDLWQVGDFWTYAGVFNIDIEGNISADIAFDFSDILLTVTDVTDDEYFLSFKGNISGAMTSSISGFDICVEIPTTIPIGGEARVNKETLGIKEINIDTTGRIAIKKTPSSVIGLPIPFELHTQIQCDDELEFFHLPYIPYKSIQIPTKELQVDGQVQSIWLKVVNILNKLTGQRLLPREIGDLLPVIDLSDMLNILGMENIRIFKYPYICEEYGDLTVDAGTFNTYKSFITNYYDTLLFNYYFAPEISNIALIDIEINDLLISTMTMNGNVKIELQSYSQS